MKEYTFHKNSNQNNIFKGPEAHNSMAENTPEEEEKAYEAVKLVEGEGHIYQLTTNYRLPRSILDVEHAMISLLSKYFPNRVDHLALETSHFQGLPPRILLDESFDDVLNEFGKELNENQAILLRSDADPAKIKKLREQVAGGHVLTIAQSKGLEFDDIIIYDFFSASRDPKAWNLLDAIAPKKEFDKEEFHQLGDWRDRQEEVASSLCDELKQFNTAITRAKQQVLIYDSTGPANPISRYMAGQCLFTSFAASGRAYFARKSTPQGWAKKGHAIKGRAIIKKSEKDSWKEALDLYIEARRCFAKAGDFRAEVAMRAQEKLCEYHIENSSEKRKEIKYAHQACAKLAGEKAEL